jgi:hypothetical protein
VEPLDLQYNDNLRVLKIFFVFPPRIALPAFSMTLSQVSSHSIEFLTIGLGVCVEYGQFDTSHFATLQPILRRPQFGHLSRLTFNLNGAEVDHLQRTIRSHFALLDAQYETLFTHHSSHYAQL